MNELFVCNCQSYIRALPVHHRQYEATPSVISRKLAVAVQITDNGAHLCLREKTAWNRNISDALLWGTGLTLRPWQRLCWQTLRTTSTKNRLTKRLEETWRRQSAAHVVTGQWAGPSRVWTKFRSALGPTLLPIWQQEFSGSNAQGEGHRGPVNKGLGASGPRGPEPKFNQFNQSNAQGVKLSTYLHLVPRLRMSGSIPLLPPHVPLWHGQEQLQSLHLPWRQSTVDMLATHRHFIRFSG
jgi:hypothetical protein